MTAALTVPRDWTEITPQWLTSALSVHHRDAVVENVTVDMRDDGTNRRARLAVTYRPGPQGPATVFVKGVDPDHKAMIKMTSGLLHEPRLFNSNIRLPLEHPTVYAAAIDEAGEEFVLVMEDLKARGADPRDATRPLTVDQAAIGVRALARMHGQFWGERLAQPALAWLEPFEPWDGMQWAPLPAALERLGDDAPPSVQALTIDHLVEGIWKPYIRTLTASSEPQTLLHGDAHIGNTYLTSDGDVGFLDWQVARRGNFAVDLGYFLQGALNTHDRRAAERELLVEYRGSLGLPAAETPSMDEIWLRYRASVAHGLTTWLATASAGELWQRPDIALVLAQRYSAAYEDLQTAEALADLES
ncbi:phosphotransferase [Mycolicibacterium goodii]|uniref:phosphotransferase n=1 Tax=Mycolicibacterium goodii TaxID=134601 RepID=UPI001BDBDB97|nr:phosphotransferase [Mycolicibacterium goodii]MBU8833527.1 phosphotransferase [Mycolicibacterium goodii]